MWIMNGILVALCGFLCYLISGKRMKYSMILCVATLYMGQWAAGWFLAAAFWVIMILQILWCRLFSGRKWERPAHLLSFALLALFLIAFSVEAFNALISDMEWKEMLYWLSLFLLVLSLNFVLIEIVSTIKKERDSSPQKEGSVEEYIEKAIQWAQSQMESKEYLFLGLAFVKDAIELANSIEIDLGDNAKESAEQYGVQKEGLPPRGSLVFYQSSGPYDGEERDWGHVGLSLGEGKVIHAWDVIREDHFVDMDKLSGAPGWTIPRYLGWTAPEVFLKGHVPKEY